MEFTDLLLGASLLAVAATFVAFIIVAVETFVKAVRQTRQEIPKAGRLIYGSFGDRPVLAQSRQQRRT